MDRMGFLPWRLWRFLEDAHVAAPGPFLLTSVGIVAMYGPRCGCPGCAVMALSPPDDPDLGRPSH